MTDNPDKPSQLARIERNERGELVAHLKAGDPVQKVRIARCFPWSRSDEYISVCDKDGKEVVLLVTLDGVDPDTQALIQDELRDKFFVPQIRRIVSYKAEFDVVYITAATDRGEVTFQIRTRDDVRLLSPGRALFRDVDGNLYELADFNALDRASQKHIEQFF